MYKRQGYDDGKDVYTLKALFALDVNFVRSRNMAKIVEAVSYTHLDVYKRQWVYLMCYLPTLIR